MRRAGVLVASVLLGWSGVVAGTTNVDFVNHAVFATPGRHATAHDSGRQRLYAGFGSTVAVLDESVPGDLTVMGWVDVPGAVDSLAFEDGGSIVYAAAGGGLTLVDVSNPKAPFVRWTNGVAGSSGTTGVDVEGTRAYTCFTGGVEGGGITVWDVSDPDAVVELASYSWYDGYGNYLPSFFDIEVRDGLAFVAGQRQFGAVPPITYAPYFEVWNLTQLVPSPPRNSLQMPGSGLPRDLSVSGIRAYVAAQSSGVHVYDVWSPFWPSHEGTYDSAGTSLGVSGSGSLVHVADGSGGFRVVDAWRASAPVEIGGVELPRPSHAEGALLAGSVVFVTARGGGLSTVDVATPALPTLIGTFPAYGADDVAVLGGHAFATTNERMTVVDVSDPLRPRVLSVWDRPGMLPRDVAALGSHAYVSFATGLHIVDVSDPSAPALLGTWDGGLSAQVYDMALGGSLVYLAGGTSGLLVVDASQPTTPTLSGTCNTPDSARDVALSGSLAYVADRSSIQVVDVGTPSAPRIVGSLATAADAITVGGTHAYAVSAGGLAVVSLADPVHPSLVTTLPLASPGVDVLASGDRLLVTESGGDVKIFDIADRASPVLVATYDVPGSLAYQAPYAYVALDALSIVHESSLCSDPYEPNDLPGSATPGSPDVSYAGKICHAADLDHFAITTASAGTLDLTLTPAAGSDDDLFLLGADEAVLAASEQAGGAVETITWTMSGPGTVYALVRGHAGAFSTSAAYDLRFTFAACPRPSLAVVILTAAKNGSGQAVLHVSDPNPPASVTGYNLYRAVSAGGPFERVRENASDEDPVTPDIQITDPPGTEEGLWFYLVRPYNAPCAAEGPP